MWTVLFSPTDCSRWSWRWTRLLAARPLDLRNRGRAPAVFSVGRANVVTLEVSSLARRGVRRADKRRPVLSGRGRERAASKDGRTRSPTGKREPGHLLRAPRRPPGRVLRSATRSSGYPIRSPSSRAAAGSARLAGQGLSDPRGAPAPAPPGGDPGLRGRRGRPAEGGGHRVCRPAAVRLRRPHPAGELARERAPPGALGQRVPHGAERGRRRVPRQFVEARRSDAPSSTAPSGRPLRSGTDTGPARRSARQLRRHLRWLRPGSGLVQRYRIVDALIETEIVFRYALKKAPSSPRGRSHPARWSLPSPRCSTLVVERAARPARPRPRSRRRRDLAGAVRRPGGEERAGVPAVAAPRETLRAQFHGAGSPWSSGGTASRSRHSSRR